MSWKGLKHIRVIISLLFFLATLFVFVDFSALLSASLIKSILFFQFVPSLLDFITGATMAASGFLWVVLITLLFGRIYCSSACPLGTLQDIITGINARIRRWKKFRFRKPIGFPRYLILGITVILFIPGNMLVLGLLDPYSLSGRFFSGLFRPAVIAINNGLAELFQSQGSYIFYTVPVKFSSVPVVVTSGILFTGIFLLALFKDRWYCTVICPVGTVLGLISRISFFRLSIDKENCNACGICSRVCKAGCIDFLEKRLDFSRCVACFNCIRWCPQKGIAYHVKAGSTEKGYQEKPSDSRRDFLKTTLALTAVAALPPAVLSQDASAEKTTDPSFPVLPPGAVSLRHYTHRCTSCHLCVSACPTGVLQPSLMAYGWTGILQPRMDFETNYCNFDCVACSAVCPTGALLLLTVERKHLTQIGISRLIRNLCIPVSKGTACGACSEHCPTKAVEMVPYLGEMKIPRISEKLCIGCGACEHVCPTRPIRAIYVESLPVHGMATEPLDIVNPEIPEKKPEEDFPF